MPSTKEQMIRQDMFAGMNRGVREHLLAANQWRTSFNMRHAGTQVRQPLRRKEMYSVLSNHTYPISLLAALPVGFENFGLMIGLTDSGVFRLTSTGAIRLGQPDGSTKLLVADGTPRRFGHTIYNNRLFFVNELNRVHSTEGTQVREVVNSPQGWFVEVFFDHIVVGRPTYNGTETPNRIQWSHLYDFSQWRADTHTEADHFDCVEHQLDDGFTGVTGLRRLGPLLITYTTAAIYVSRYVGLPRVMVTDAIIQDYGNGLPYALASNDKSHFFVDVRQQSFYRFDGGAVSEIGDPIKAYFFADISTNHSFAGRTWAYNDPFWQEIHWVYCSGASSGDYDREVVFNYRENKWWAGSVENIWAFSRGTRRTKSIDDLTGTIDNLSGNIDSLAEAGDIMPRVYGSRNGRLLREEVSADTTASLLEQPATPYLDTGDYHYNDIENQKEVESMVIHTKYDDAAGIDVYAASRNHIDDTVTLNLLPQTWVPTLSEQRLSFPRIPGRIFRYKFQPKQVTTTTVTETRGRPTSGFSLLAQIPAVVEPPPPAVGLLFSYTSGISLPNYSIPVTVPAGSNTGMFVWLHWRKASGGPLAMVATIDGNPATVLFSAIDDDLGFGAYLFYVVGNATGLINIDIGAPGLGTTLTMGRVHVVGACVTNLNQTLPIISLNTSFNILNNGFSFPSSTNHLLLPGLVVYSKLQIENIPFPTPYTGSTYTGTIFRSFSSPPYISDGINALGYRIGASSVTAGWTMDPAAEGGFDWWNIAVALRGV